MCRSHLIYTVRPCLIHTCHAMPCSVHAVLLKATAQHGRREKAVLCYGLEKKNGMVGAWHGHSMTSVNQTRPHCVNQMGTTHSKPLAVRHGRGTAWALHAMCESAFRLPSRPFAATKCGSRNNSNNSDINMSSAIGHTAIICNLRQFCLLYLCKASLVSCPGTRQLYHMESLHPPGRHVTAILLR